MTYGGALFLIAVGAILKFAVTATVGGIDIATVGLILMVVGVAGLILGFFLSTRRVDGVVQETRVRDPRDPRL